MGTDQGLQSGLLRARRWFWRLLALSILLMGGVYRAIYAEPGLLTGAAFLALASLLVATLVQAARVWVALQNAARGGTPPPGKTPPAISERNSEHGGVELLVRDSGIGSL